MVVWRSAWYCGRGGDSTRMCNGDSIETAAALSVILENSIELLVTCPAAQSTVIVI